MRPSYQATRGQCATCASTYQRGASANEVKGWGLTACPREEEESHRVSQYWRGQRHASLSLPIVSKGGQNQPKGNSHGYLRSSEVCYGEEFPTQRLLFPA